MNTKTVKLDDDTRRIMRSCSIKQVGSEWTLDLPQLERKDYDKAKKAITALGCIWMRGRGTHVCSSDPTEAITGVVNGDNLEVAQYDFFPTPMPLVWRMVELADIQPEDWCLEPEAGDGRIAMAMWEAPAPRHPRNVCVCEINPAAQRVLESKGFHIDGEDFLQYNPPLMGFTKIVMNPPFSKEQDILHIRHAWDLLAPNGRIVAIASEHAWVASNNRCTQFHEWLDDLGAMVEELPEGTFKESGTMIKTRLVVINKPINIDALQSSVGKATQQELWAAFQ